MNRLTLTLIATALLAGCPPTPGLCWLLHCSPETEQPEDNPDAGDPCAQPDPPVGCEPDDPDPQLPDGGGVVGG